VSKGVKEFPALWFLCILFMDNLVIHGLFHFKLSQDRQFVYFLLEAALGGDLYGMFSSHQETWLKI